MASSRWYARLLDTRMLACSTADSHGNVYNRLYAGDSMVLQLHSWDDEDHPNLTGEHDAKHGHGVLAWFEVDDFDAAVQRARALKADIILGPLVNEGPDHREL